MPQRSVFGDRSHLPLLLRPAVVAATILTGLLACGALLAALGGPVPRALAAGPVTYPGSAPCDTTLQACIDGSVTGTTIVVQPNTYVTNALTLNKAVSLTGVSSATVILQAMANQRVLTVTGAAVDSSVIISGLTFAGGHAVGGGCPDGCGGAILINASAQPLLINLTITNNSADWEGGGLLAFGPLVMSGVAVLSNFSIIGGGGAFAYGNVTLNGGVFQNNQCPGAFCVGGGLIVVGNMVLTGTQFLSNTGAGSGGGAFADGNMTLTGGVFQNNQCTGANCTGGGLYAGATLAVTHTRFLSNTSTSNGGGAVAYGNVTLIGGLFQNNQCTGANCNGGGLFASASVTVTNALFLGNTAQTGAGLYHSYGDGRLVNDLFTANSALSGQGDALFLDSRGAVSLLHTTIASPTVGSGAAIVVANGTVGITDTIIASYTTGISQTAGTAYEDYNLFFNVPVTFTGAVASGGHSLIGNPAFRDPFHDDYHITAGSAARNKGVNVGVTIDFEGDPRPFGGGFDIGFDQYVANKLFLALLRR